MNAYVIALLAAAQPTSEPQPSPQPGPEAVAEAVAEAGPEAETGPEVAAVEDPPEVSSPAMVPEVPAGPGQSETGAVAPGSAADDPGASEAMRRAEATKAVRRADALFREGRYEHALNALADAESHWPDPAHDFMRGAIENRRGNCSAAKRAFQRFLDQNPPAVDADVARGQIRDCQDEAPPMPLVPAFEATPPDGPTRTPARPAPQAKPWFRDVPAGVLLGVGAAGTMVGAGFLIANRRDTEQPEQYDDFVEIGERQDRRKRIGTGVIIASSTLIAASVIRYVWVGRRSRRESDRAAVSLFAPGPAGSAALLRW